MQKARTMSHSVPSGPELLAAVTERRAELAGAARAGRPPVVVISGVAVEMLGLEQARQVLVRQFLGTCVRAVLDADGFEVENPKVRIAADSICRTGATYRERRRSDPPDGLLERFLANLSDEEAARAVEILRDRLSDT